ncbi:hypothetical protein [Virgibacillus doumboii]|uniref:hypothetical protein n=1 Tax=Virgibacillus doumboii TaxID=2697503 RepID=UPI0013DF904C|nr:hypothetical protein [Virgibacillus doumboii]
MKKNKQRMYLTGSIGLAIILLLSFIIQTGGLLHSASAVNYSEIHKTSKTSKVQVKTMNTAAKNQISHEQIVSLTEEFMDILVQDTNNQYKVIHFDTKEALLKEFERVTIRNVAAKYVDYYFQEKKNGLFIRPTETPPWFNAGNDYDMIKVEDNVVKVVQKNKTDLYGAYTVKFEFTYDNQWKITNIAYE